MCIHLRCLPVARELWHPVIEDRTLVVVGAHVSCFTQLVARASTVSGLRSSIWDVKVESRSRKIPQAGQHCLLYQENHISGY